ncbi:MAG TPA: methylated-DNA--[protein]-cysteine S-methyltransferase [Candidatus Angelobacter sp.]|nr:methylated-DNA--[protein]-cysteine S-methyltransferase [Candidatus Angelobacter sp.]
MPKKPYLVHYYCMQSPLGALLLAATGTGLRAIYFDGRKPAPDKDQVWIESEEALRPYRNQLDEYFLGNRREFTCPLDLIGTGFQKRCWDALRKIPYGKTCSYADLAKAVGSPLGFRAVGQANHNNPVPIIVPCHRVIGSNGTLTGYGGGLSIKEKLLELEGISTHKPLLFA